MLRLTAQTLTIVLPALNDYLPFMASKVLIDSSEILPIGQTRLCLILLPVPVGGPKLG